jgi:amino acid adenylation domain-containing protein/non-ribosomal peptide synthase protein (TIGR01720 family)
LEFNVIPGIKKDFQGEDNYVKDTRSLSFDLGEEETGLLLSSVNRAFKTEINDILLTALGLAIKKAFAQDRVLIALEGHGREETIEDIDISRTVGWFTSLYPVVMDVSYADDPGRQVKEIKETLRRIPNKGIGHGILKYLTNEENKNKLEFKLNPQISFNYMGQVDTDIKQISFFEIAKEPAGSTQSLKNRRRYDLDISGMTVNNRLTMTCSYNKNHFKPGTIQALMSHFQSELCHIIAFCCSKENIELTPSDFTYKGLSIESIGRLMEEYPGLEDIYTLTPMQEGMLFHALHDDTSYSYFEQVSYRLQGELNIDLVEKSLNELFKRHDILRTAFVYQEVERPVQVVLRDRFIDFYYQDINKIATREEKENFIKEFKVKDKERSFDLSKGVLMRVSILRLGKREHEFTWSFHHILMDGWCIEITNTEFFEIYTSYLQNRPYRLPEVKSYRTYIQWLEKKDKETPAWYWQDYLESFEEQTSVPQTKIIKQKENRYKNETVLIELNLEKVALLNQAAAGHHVTLNTLFQAIWGILLGRYNGKEDVVFGAVVSGRPFELEGVESMVGLFINAIPVRIRFAGKMKFHQLLQMVQEKAIASEPYHYYPLPEIQSGTSLKQNLIDHLFIFENYPIVDHIKEYESDHVKKRPLLKLSHVEVFEQTNYDFNIVLVGSDRLRISFKYNGNVYDRDFVERIAKHFSLIVDQVIENPESEIKELTLLAEEEKNRLLYEFNDTDADYPKDKTIHRLFEEQVERTPDNIALHGCMMAWMHGEEGSITYKELNEKSNFLANKLKDKGIEPNTIVGIMLERSVEMIVGILGILKFGGAYLPIDPEYPKDRIDFMLKDSAAKILVTTGNLAKEGEKVRRWEDEKNFEIIFLENFSSLSILTSDLSNFPTSQPPNFPLLLATRHRPPATSLAYIIYTSGTTGKPKGVMVQHFNVVRLVKNTNYIEFRKGDRILQTGALEFDASTFEIWGSLLNGLELYLVSQQVILAPGKLKETIQKNGISTIWLTSPLFNQLSEVEIEIFRGLKSLLVGGDILSPSHINRLRNQFPQLNIINGYGPTENTTFSTTYLIDKEYHERIPIGKPIANSTAYIVNKYGYLQPVGVVGELWLGGDGVARGYLNNPELTVEKFCLRRPGALFEKTAPGPHKNFLLIHSPIYKTGDLVRWMEDGNIEFLGRIDYQVKVRGFRIELEEIEIQLLAHDQIKSVVVMAKQDSSGDTYLAAYIVPGMGGGISIPAVRGYLLAVLPGYMVPAYFILLDELPLTSSGKIDRRALPDPQTKTESFSPGPRDEIEQKLVDIWTDILSLHTPIGIDDNFFTSGGHSLKAVLLAARIHKVLAVKLSLNEIFKNPTIRELAQFIKKAIREHYTPIKPVEAKEFYPLSSAQKRLYLLHQMYEIGMAYNIAWVGILEGVIETDRLENTFKQLIRRHENLRTSFAMIDAEPIQRIHDEVEFEIEYYETGVEAEVEAEAEPFGQIFDTSDESPGKETERTESPNSFSKSQELKAKSYINHFIRPFDLARAPLLRVGLIKMENHNHIIMINMHHIIMDGTSIGIFIKEFMMIYGGGELPVLRHQYRDFSVWQNSENKRDEIKKQEEYWKKQFEGEIPVLNLPGDYTRPTVLGFAGSSLVFAIGKKETAALIELAKKENITLFMLLLAMYNVFLAKLSGQEDIVVGVPIVGRGHEDLQPIIGMFVNTLALRNYPGGNKPFNVFLKEIKEKTLAAFENQDYLFEDLVDQVVVDRDVSRNPLFDTMLALQNMEMEEILIPGLRLRPYGFDSGVSHFDLVFIAGETEEQLSFYVEYSTRLFKKTTVERMIGFFKDMLSFILTNPHREISAIPFIGEEEKQQVLVDFNDTEAGCAGERTIHRWFQEQAGKTPDRIGVVSRPDGLVPGKEEKVRGTIQLTYKKLNEKSNQLARLLKSRGMAPGSTAALLMDSSIEMIIGILGILKAGGAYQPIDPAYPGERIRSILEDSQAPVLLTQHKVLQKLSLHFTFLKKLKTPTVEPFKTIPRQQIKDLNILPPPDRTLVDYEKYHRFIGIAMAQHTVSLQANRGCPFNCVYCHKIWPKTHVIRSADHVFAEILRCREAGVRRFVFIGDIFNLNIKNSSRLLEKIIRHNLDIQLFFPNGLRGDILTRDFIDLMIEAGTVNIDLALESASPRIQELIRKNLDLEKFRENICYIAEKYPQLMLEVELMVGFPSETEKEAKQTLDFLKEIKWAHFPNLNILKIFPNSDMYRLALEHGISEKAIEISTHLGFHELPETLPFAKSFVRQVQSEFMKDYFLLKERLLQVLPKQMKLLTENELVQKYDSYLPGKISSFSDILSIAGISEHQLAGVSLLQGDPMAAPDFSTRYSPVTRPGKKKKPDNALRLLLLDLSQLFNSESSNMIYDMVEPPLGLMYLLTYLDQQFAEKIQGKIAKSRIDFDDYNQLKTLITDFKPDLIGIRTLTFYKEFFHRTVSIIRQWGIKVPIITGGPYATSDYKQLLQNPYINLVVLGEGELTLAELVEKMIQNNNHLPGDEILKNIPGIAFVKESDKAILKENNRDVLLLDRAMAGNEWSAYPNENLDHVNRIDDLLYLISTSGSSGIPRSVILEHRNLANLLHYQFSRTGVDFSGHVLQFAAVGFDVSAQEIFSTLLSGGKLHLMDSEMKSDLPRWFDFIRENQIEIIFLPPVFLRFIFDDREMAARFPICVRHIIAAGEALVIPELLKHHLSRHRVYLHNHYGPSETHVVTAFIIDPAGEIPALPPIGEPISNTQIYILDKYLNLQPIGIAGELCIGGNNVGRGYLNNPELTARKFQIADKTGYHRSYKSYIIYKTGDLARWMPDGNIEFSGRIDHQVKIRGFRIEMGEIEKRLTKFPGIKESLVINKEINGEMSLCAYVVSHNDIHSAEIRDKLVETLPEYMIPSYFIRLAGLPLSPNGKIDRKALPHPGLKVGDRYTAPRDEIEKQLVKIWAELLQLEERVIGIDDNFFALGGHSLKATLLTNKIYRTFQVEIPLVEIFKQRTIRELSKYIKGAVKVRYVSIEPAEKKEYYGLSSAQKRLYIHQQMQAGSTMYNLPGFFVLEEEADESRLEWVFKKMIHRHESLRTSIEIVGKEAVQRIYIQVPFKIENHDISGFNDKSEQEERIIRHFVRPFDLSRPPLFRVGLIKTGPGRTNQLLMVDMNHIVTDGVSIKLLMWDFISLLARKELPQLKLQYKDYAIWQRGILEKEKGMMTQQEEYWIKEFSEEIPALVLPTDYPRPQVQRFEGGKVSFAIGMEETRGLKKLAAQEQATLYMVLLAVFNILLSKLSNREIMVVGTAVAGRQHPNLEKIIGMFVNTVALKNHPSGGKSFIQFLGEVKENTLNAFDNQDYQFEELVEKIVVKRDRSRNPLFDVMFEMLGDELDWVDLAQGKIRYYNEESQEYIKPGSKFDMTLVAIDNTGPLSFMFIYNTHLFKEKSIYRFVNALKHIIEKVTGDNKIPIAEINVFSASEGSEIAARLSDDLEIEMEA